MVVPEVPAWPLRPALFLDVDGTVVEFADRPDAVELSPRLRILLKRLSNLRHGAVAFVSGRTVADLDRLLAPHRFPLAGLHGHERRDSGGRYERAVENVHELAAARRVLHEFQAAHPGTILEDKGAGLALHYRQRPDLSGAIDRLARELASSLPTGYGSLHGNEVLEAKPTLANKGYAIRSFMGERPFFGRTPVFIADDVGDEDGFGAVNELGGVSVKVSVGHTAARWRVPDVDHVLSWLEEMPTD